MENELKIKRRMRRKGKDQSHWVGKTKAKLRELAESPGQACVRLAIPISSLHTSLELPEDFCEGKPHLQVLDEMFLLASRNESPGPTITHFLEKL